MARLVLDDADQAVCVLDGCVIPLQPRQYQLLRVLALRPGEVRTYADIYESLFGDEVVEDNQIGFQRGKLVKRLQEGASAGDLVETVNGKGLRLRLAADDVVIVASEAVVMAMDAVEEKRKALDRMVDAAEKVAAVAKRSGARTGEMVCPLCQAALRWATLGPKRHLRIQCRTEGCLRVVE